MQQADKSFELRETAKNGAVAKIKALLDAGEQCDPRQGQWTSTGPDECYSSGPASFRGRGLCRV